MKKGLCIILSALVLALSFTACSKKPGKDEELKTKVNKDGVAYVEMKDDKGEPITDESGEVVTSIVSENDEGKKDAPKKDQGKKEDPKKDTGKDNNANTGDIKVNQNVVDKFSDGSGLEMTASDKDLIPEGTTTKKTTLFENNVQKIIESGRFTVDMSVTADGTKSPMKMVFDKDRMYTSVSISGLDAGILYMNGKAYILLPNLFMSKCYIESSDMNEDMGELFGSFGDITDNGGKYVGSSTVKVGGKTYICEEYKNEDGSVAKYYFEGNAWKRYECISDEGNLVYEINSFSGKVDESVFSLKGYTKIDEKALAGLMG